MVAVKREMKQASRVTVAAAKLPKIKIGDLDVKTPLGIGMVGR